MTTAPEAPPTQFAAKTDAGEWLVTVFPAVGYLSARAEVAWRRDQWGHVRCAGQAHGGAVVIRAQADVAAVVDTEYAYVAAVAMLPNVRYYEADGFAEARRWIPVLRGDLVYRAPLPGGAS